MKRALFIGAMATVVFAALGGCTDLATPAELSHPQILGIRAEPPLIAPGERTTITSLIAGQTGRITGVEVTWSVVGAPGRSPFGNVEATATGAEYVAPESVPANGEDPIAVAAVKMVAQVDGYTLVGQKLIGVGPGTHENPALTEIAIDGVIADGQTEIVIPAGATVPISATTTPPLGDTGQIAWYATAGEIEIYRGEETELVAPEAPTSAVMFVVARDGLGGIAWQEIPLRFE